MNELQFNVMQEAGVIDVNFSVISKELAKKMKEYKNALFTEETKSIAKGELANLRKLKKSIDDRRKEVKNACLRPYEEFEVQVKRLMELIDEPIVLIDSQIKNFEEKRIQERKVKIREVYEELIGDMIDYLPLDKIYNPKWDNASTKLKVIETDITDVVSSTRKSVQILKDMQSDCVQQALKTFKTSLSITEAISFINNYERQKIEILNREEKQKQEQEELMRQKEINRIRAEERFRISEEERIRKETQKETLERVAQVNEELAAPLSEKASETVIYTVVATTEEQREIEMALTSIGVYFERKDI